MNKSTLKMNFIGSALIMVEIKMWSRLDEVFRKMYLTIDTGASVTTISKDIIHQLGYEFDNKEKARITTASGVEYVDSVCLDKIQIGNFVLKNIDIYAHTFPEESFSLGVLGLNVLEQFDVNLLFGKGLIVFDKIEG